MSINEAILKRRYSLFLPCADNSQEQGNEARGLSRNDGRVVVEVQPEEETEGGPRRSTRKRNAIVYDS